MAYQDFKEAVERIKRKDHGHGVTRKLFAQPRRSSEDRSRTTTSSSSKSMDGSRLRGSRSSI